MKQEATLVALLSLWALHLTEGRTNTSLQPVPPANGLVNRIRMETLYNLFHKTLDVDDKPAPGKCDIVTVL